MSASQDFVALDWIKGEIANTLQQAQTALESVAEDPSDATSMRACLTALHQVHGTLRMVELQGPTQVAEEMETLAQALMNQTVDDVERAQEVLMQAILQVPGHLERIQREQADNPVLLLPIVNNLRTMRGEAVIASEAEGGAAGDRFAALAEPGPGAAENFDRRSGSANAVKLRQRYRQALQQILKKVKTRDNLTLLGKVFNNLDKLCGESAMGYLGIGGVALIEAVATGALRFDNRVVRWLRDVDRSLAELGARGSEALAHGVEVRQIESLLELFEQAPKSTPRMEKFAGAFPLPAPAELPGVGPDPEAIAAVVVVMLEELRGVTEKLDLFVRSDSKDLSELASLIPVLEQMSSTLLVVDMGDHRRVVEEQIQVLRDIEASGSAPDEEQLIQIAGAFLQIIAELSPLAGETEDGDGDSFADLDEAHAAVIREIRNGLAQCKDAVIEFISSGWDRARLEDTPETLNSLRGSLTIVNQQRCGDVLAACAVYCTTRLLERPDVTPALDEMDDLADAITSVDYYFERLLENANDPYVQMIEVAEASVARLAEVEATGAGAQSVELDVAEPDAAEPAEEAALEEAGLEEAALEEAALEEAALEEAAPEAADTVTVAEGAGEIAPQAEVAPNDASTTPVEAEPPVQEDVPEEFAAAEPGLEESGLEEPGPRAAASEAVQQSVTQTGATVDAAAPDAQAALPTQEPDTVLISPAILDGEDEQGTTSVDARAAEAAEVASVAGDASDEPLIDDEILEIFVEEAAEVMDSLHEVFPQWRDNQDADALGDVRRAFHTLKGSGRMVGAEVVGELAWSVEDMLNRVIDETIVPGPGMFELVSDVLERIPGGVEDFKSGNQSATVVDDLIARAERYSRGEGDAGAVAAPLAEEPASLEVESSVDAEPAADTVTLDAEGQTSGVTVEDIDTPEIDASEIDAPDIDAPEFDQPQVEDAVIEAPAIDEQAAVESSTSEEFDLSEFDPEFDPELEVVEVDPEPEAPAEIAGGSPDDTAAASTGAASTVAASTVADSTAADPNAAFDPEVVEAAVPSDGGGPEASQAERMAPAEDNPAFDTQGSDSLDVENEIGSEVEDSVSFAAEDDAALDVDGAIAREVEDSVSFEAEDNATLDVEDEIAPEIEDSVSFGADDNATLDGADVILPEVEADVSFDTEDGIAPDIAENVQAGVEESISLDAAVDLVPDADDSTMPDVRDDIVPDAVGNVPFGAEDDVALGVEGEFGAEDEETLIVEDDLTLPVDDNVTFEAEDDVALDVDDHVTFDAEDDAALSLEDNVSFDAEDDAELELEGTVPFDAEADAELELEGTVTSDAEDDAALELQDNVTFDAEEAVALDVEDNVSFDAEDDAALELDDNVTFDAQEDVALDVEDNVSFEAEDNIAPEVEDNVAFDAADDVAPDAADSVTFEETDLASVGDVEVVAEAAAEPDPGATPLEPEVEAGTTAAIGTVPEALEGEALSEALDVPAPDAELVEVASTEDGETVSIDEPESLVEATDATVSDETNSPDEATTDDDAFADFELEDIGFDDEIDGDDDGAAAFEPAVALVEPAQEPAAPAVVETVGTEDAEASPVDSPFEVVDLASELTDADLNLAALENIEIETVDPDEEEDILTMFAREASGQVATIQSFIDGPASTNPMPADVVAALHTLRGGGGMANVSSVHRVAGALEDACLPLVHAGEPPQPPLILALQEGLLLVQRALSDIGAESALTDTVDDYEQRVQQLSAEPAPTFDLSTLILIPQYDDVLDRWDSSELDALVEELSNVSVQAADLGMKEALALSGALLNVYEQLTAAPEGNVRTVLNAGHEALIAVLDQIAAGQQLEYDVAVVNALQSIDLAAEQEAADRRLFINEAWDALGNVESAISKWQTDISNQQPLEAINQQLSAVENMAGQYDQPTLVAVIEPMIQLCERLVAGDTIASQEDAELLILGRQDLITQLGVLREGRIPEPEAGLMAALAGRLQAREEAPSAEAAEGGGAAATLDLPEDDLDDVDEEILAIFIEEAEELVEEIDESINEWSTDTGTDSHLKNLLRHLHTLKGGARLAGLASLGEYTHDFETFLIGVQNKPVDLNEGFFALINQRQDEITRRVGIYRKLASGEASADDLKSLTSAPAPGAPAEVPAEPAAAEVVSTDEPPASAEAPEQDTADAGSTPSGTTAAQEMVRVGADLLEELIILAGESSITRGRVEQQISDFGDSLNEMEETINRIREQVRRLEIEAESRETLIRTQTHAEGDSAFDDLEMDRYTMLQEISRSLTEGASDMLDLKDTLVNKSRDAETLLHQQSRIGAELQEGLTRTRMVPFARLIPRLRRIVRQISAEVGKSVRFDAFNVEGEIDRSVLERIVAPLEHMLRNAVDHGIESVDGRRAANKPETGRISLRLSREGGYFVLEISDDGAGIDVGRVKEKAIERGLVAADTQLSDLEIMQFIMKAGFSTAQQLTQISGRGVGMDVVDSEIKQLGGTISIDSTLGVGTEFVIRLPFTVSINRALMVVVKEETYAVPLNTIEGIVRVSPYELDAYYQPDAPMFEYAGQPYRLTYMGKVLERSDNPDLEGQVAPLPVILARTGDNAIAMQVDRVIGSREVVVKALGKQFSELDGVSGATVLGDGSVVIILDVMALVRGADAQEAAAAAAAAPEAEPVAPDANRVRTVMIVDDSVTVRKVTSRLMERQGWEVSTAKDGVDAVNQLQDTMPDVVLLDIEMPRMDGFEVLRTVRRDPRLADLPIIMITSRTGEKHQQQALELGVNRFLGKPFQEANLLQTINEVLASARG